MPLYRGRAKNPASNKVEPFYSWNKGSNNKRHFYTPNNEILRCKAKIAATKDKDNVGVKAKAPAKKAPAKKARS